LYFCGFSDLGWQRVRVAPEEVSMHISIGVALDKPDWPGKGFIEPQGIVNTAGISSITFDVAPP
jgi:hypothetical protein